jgi:hypothetical protein
MKMTDAHMAPPEPKWSIIDAEDCTLWSGDAVSIEVIFNCQAGLCFGDEKYRQHMVWMTAFTEKTFPGGANPYAPGLRIALQDERARQVAWHRFE